MTNTNNLPETLKQRGLFCLWQYEERDGRQTKMPYNPNRPQDRAKSNDRSTFAPMATAQERAAGFDGIGIGIFDDIAGIDIDHCIDDAGKLSPMAQDIVQTMDAYTEISPSGKGLRILFLAPGFQYDKDRFYIKESKQGLEIYIAGMTNRYLTVTGNTLRSCDLVDRTQQLQSVLDRYMKRSTEQQPQGQQSLDSWQYVRMQQREWLQSILAQRIRYIMTVVDAITFGVVRITKVASGNSREMPAYAGQKIRSVKW